MHLKLKQNSTHHLTSQILKQGIFIDFHPSILFTTIFIKNKQIILYKWYLLGSFIVE